MNAVITGSDSRSDVARMTIPAGIFRSGGLFSRVFTPVPSLLGPPCRLARADDSTGGKARAVPYPPIKA